MQLSSGEWHPRTLGDPASSCAPTLGGSASWQPRAAESFWGCKSESVPARSSCRGKALKSSGQKSQQDRRRDRAQARVGDLRPGFLRRAVVTRQTADRYTKHVDQLVQFDKRVVSCAPELADDIMANFVEKQFLAGASKEVGRYTLCGLTWWRGWSGRGASFHRTKATVKGWDRLEPAFSREPCPWEMALAMAEVLSSWDDAAVEAAAATLIAFDCYLRPSECLKLSRASVVPPHGRGLGDKWAIIVAPSGTTPSKTNTYDDTVIAAEPRTGRSDVRAILAALRGRTLSGPLFALKLPEWNAMLKQAAMKLCWTTAFTAHQLRHGGASQDALSKALCLKQIQRRGRWEAESSVKRYEKHGVLLRTRQKFPVDTFRIMQSRQKVICTGIAKRLRKKIRSV